jgi:uncharacterized protein (TIGR00255 family)
MILSMTGFGRGEVTVKGVTGSAELRSVNSRFLEVVTRLPRALALRENDVKDAVRRRMSRGKVNVQVTVDRETDGSIPVRLNAPMARAYASMLNQLRKTTKVRETVKLGHLLQFADIFEPMTVEASDELEWGVAQKALDMALDDLGTMREKEGRELERDFRERIASLERQLERVQELSAAQVPQERERLTSRIKQLLDGVAFDDSRIEMEIVMLAERLDVTEECVRFRSHLKFFLEAVDSREPAGRKLNFLLQEINREANTIGSKSSATGIAHSVVGMKEELEKIREQLQNIE